MHTVPNSTVLWLHLATSMCFKTDRYPQLLCGGALPVGSIPFATEKHESYVTDTNSVLSEHPSTILCYTSTVCAIITKKCINRNHQNNDYTK